MTTTITPLSAPPSREEPNTFRTRTDTLLSELPVMVTEINVVTGEINASATAAAASQASASLSKTTAQAAETAAIATSGATVYGPAIVYDFPDTVICTDGQTYRCIGSNVTGDNPIGSVTGNWVQVVGKLDVFSFEALFIGA